MHSFSKERYWTLDRTTALQSAILFMLHSDNQIMSTETTTKATDKKNNKNNKNKKMLFELIQGFILVLVAMGTFVCIYEALRPYLERASIKKVYGSFRFDE